MTAAAVPAPMPALPDPAGVPHKGNQNHEQFIGGECINSNDCALNTACCAVLGDIGVCSGLGASTQQGKSGCGFGDAADGTDTSGGNDGTNVVPVTPAPSQGTGSGSGSGSGSGNTGSVTLDPNAPGAANVGKANGSQFITGQCTSDKDCASACCATGGKCAAPGALIGDATRQCGFVGTLA